MLYIVEALVVVLLVVVFLISRAPSRILFLPTPEGEFGESGEVSNLCTQHYHSFWQWFGKDEDGDYYIVRNMTHFWVCTSETCPTDGKECERPQPHQQWGVGPKIHDKSL